MRTGYSSFITNLPLLLLLTLLPTPILSLSYQLSMDPTTPDTTITSYYTDIGSCQCDIHPSSCDVFCCCDPSCTSSQTSSWSSQSLCQSTHSSLQSSCDNLNSGGHWSFDDLACVYYSNRGNINYFYSYPDTGSVNYPAPDHFVARIGEMEYINVASSMATANAYSGEELLVKIDKGSNVKRYLEVWAPVAGGNCGVGYVNVSQAETYSCSYSLNPTTCLSSTSLFSTTYLLCKNGECTQTTPILPSLTPTTLPTTDLCSNLVTSQTIELTISSSGKAYRIDSISVTLQQKDINMTLNPRYQVKTTVKVSIASGSIVYAGNPGYWMGKQVAVERANGTAFSFLSIGDSSGSCYLTSNTDPSSSIELVFGQNAVYSCQLPSSSPCSSSLYIDSLPLTPLQIKKWPQSSPATIPITLPSSPATTLCSQQLITLNILYSTGGLVSDLQNYVIGAEMTTKASAEAVFDRKYLKVNWVYVDPGVVAGPKENYFYQYFQYMWKPLREYFGVY